MKIHIPSRTEIQQLHRLLEDACDSQGARQAEAVLPYAAGLNGVEIAHLLAVHPNMTCMVTTSTA